jgi:hypothetical protein
LSRPSIRQHRETNSYSRLARLPLACWRETFFMEAHLQLLLYILPTGPNPISFPNFQLPPSTSRHPPRTARPISLSQISSARLPLPIHHCSVPLPHLIPPQISTFSSLQTFSLVLPLPAGPGAHAIDTELATSASKGWRGWSPRPAATASINLQPLCRLQTCSDGSASTSSLASSSLLTQLCLHVLPSEPACDLSGMVRNTPPPCLHTRMTSLTKTNKMCPFLERNF